MVLGAVAYVVSPIDLIPELALSVFGLADDAVVVSWIAADRRQRDRVVPGLGAHGSPSSDCTTAEGPASSGLRARAGPTSSRSVQRRSHADSHASSGR